MFTRQSILVICHDSIRRRHLMGLSMTAADICSSHKQWDVQQFNVSVIVEEFFLQVTNYPPIISSFMLFRVSSCLAYRYLAHVSCTRGIPFVRVHVSMRSLSSPTR